MSLPPCFASPDTSATALPLVLVDRAGYPAWRDKQPAAVQAWLAAQDFSGQSGAPLLVPGGDGRPAYFLAGVSDPKDPLALAHLPSMLPPGSYRLAADAPLALEPGQALLGWGHRAVAWMWLPIPAIVAFGIAGMSLVVLFLVRRSSVEPGLLWALAAMFLGMNQMMMPEALLLYAGTASLMLVFAVLDHGYDIAYRDELTGLPGRRAFNHIMEQLGGNYALAMCDVDNFKQLNDTYGHETGDQILRMVAVKLSQVGGGGRAFRYGGEEFLLVFRGLSARDAHPFVEKVRSAIAGGGFVVRGADRPPRKPVSLPTTRNRTTITITVSAGIAGRSQRHSSAELVLDAADAALYRAKEAGRNCVRLAESTPGEREASRLTESPSAGAT